MRQIQRSRDRLGVLRKIATMHQGLAVIALTSLLSASVSGAVCAWSCAVEQRRSDAHHCEETRAPADVVSATRSCGEHAGMDTATFTVSFRVDVTSDVPRSLAYVWTVPPPVPSAAAAVDFFSGSPPDSRTGQVLRI